MSNENARPKVKWLFLNTADLDADGKRLAAQFSASYKAMKANSALLNAHVAKSMKVADGFQVLSKGHGDKVKIALVESDKEAVQTKESLSDYFTRMQGNAA